MSTVDFIPVLNALKDKLNNTIIPGVTSTTQALEVAESLKLVETLISTLNTEEVGDTKIAAIAAAGAAQLTAIQNASTTEQNNILAMLVAQLGIVALTTDITLNSTQYGATMISFTGEIYNDITVTVPATVGGKSFINKTTGLGSVWVKVVGSSELIYLPRNQYRHLYNDGVNLNLSSVDKYLDSIRAWKLGSKYNGDNSNRPRIQSWYIMRDRSLSCFGETESGEFAGLNTVDGNHGTQPRVNPSNSIPSTSPIKELFTGLAETFALLEDNTLYCIGYNASGQLGLGDTVTRNRWVKHPLENVKKVIVSSWKRGNQYHTTHILLNDGRCYGMGHNNWGGVGDGTTVQRNSPVLINSGESWDDIYGSCESEPAVRFAKVTATQQLKCWGRNVNGELGLGDTTQRNSPSIPLGLPSGYQIKKVITTTANNSGVTVQYSTTLVLLTDGRIYAAGINQYGQLGDGTTTQRTSFIQVPGITNAIDICLGGDYGTSVMALLSDGTVRTWGHNGAGQLGINDTTNRSSPQNPGLANIKKIMQIGGEGNSSMFALDKNNQVWAWGRNNMGQTGAYAVANLQGAIDSNILVPTKIAQGRNKIIDMNYIAYNTDGDNPQFLTDDGRVLVCGLNDKGQLGIGPDGLINSSYGYCSLQEVNF